MESRVKETEVLIEEYLSNHEDPLIQLLHKIIRQAVRFLSILMVLIIIWGIGDVIYSVYQKLEEPPFSVIKH
ncbi:MAG: hypothetical protein MRK02_09795 [Candidatus Scalindua sp.]|nr:hypothetical protein [Candidatus Scalindua sp.]